MLEYLFMHPQTRDRFIARAGELGLAAEIRPEEDDGWLVLLPEVDDEQLLDQLEACYDELFNTDEQMWNEERASQQFHTAGLLLTLGDGSQVQAPVPPALMNKLLQVLSMEEVAELVSIIVDAVEARDGRSLCQRHRDGDL